MGLTALYGIGAGALHAVTGPDHVLSLGPAALGAPKRSFSIGLRWGIGHALGTLLVSIPLLFAVHLVELSVLASIGDRLSALALFVMGAWSYRALRGSRHFEHARDRRGPHLIGLVHGIAGAGSLLLVLPVLVSGSLARTLLFLFAFGAGSTFAMAGLTSVLAKLGSRIAGATLARAQRGLAALSMAIGAVLLVV
jgi:hypothetical protein